MKKGKMFLMNRYEKAGLMAFYPDSPRRSELAADIPEKSIVPQKVSNLLYLLSQTCASVHEIALTQGKRRSVSEQWL